MLHARGARILLSQHQAAHRASGGKIRGQGSRAESPGNRLARRNRLDGYRDSAGTFGPAENSIKRRMPEDRKQTGDQPLACEHQSHPNACDGERDWDEGGMNLEEARELLGGYFTISKNLAE